jgi:hypothetical protein
MHRSPCRARLFINGVDVGAVAVKGWEGSWGIGEFRAGEAFAPYAATFGLWSMLMHDDAHADRLSDAALQELRRVECELDALRAELLLCDSGERRRIRQLNIDGPLIEWKEDRGPGVE